MSHCRFSSLCRESKPLALSRMRHRHGHCCAGCAGGILGGWKYQFNVKDTHSRDGKLVVMVSSARVFQVVNTVFLEPSC